ncbi:MAG: thioredoxin domain-containing protein [SAR324 cluster bacterium]|uniref:Thioredoxin domain-containing protein n=1 Tax=SAR324 cluster bacterium TaxID=2024889 RepID=A0A7X9IK81_9DELT|nr:thioredoxin domain-containing protein [SAR324 cluster bacterium]
MEKKKKGYLFVICLALFIAVGLSALSLLHYVEFKFGLRYTPTFCNLNDRFNCDVVTQSDYSSILGIPIASYGLVFYSALFALAFISLAKNGSVEAGIINRALLLGAIFAGIFSVYLFLVSELIIGVLCPTCMGLYLCNAIFLYCAYKVQEGGLLKSLRVSLVEAFGVFPKEVFNSWRKKGFFYEHRWLLLICITIAVLVLLVPLLMTFITSTRTEYGLGRESVQKYVRQWNSESSVSFLFEQEGINRDYSKGNPFAAVTIVEFSDFECPTCHAMNFDLEELLSDFGDRVRFVFKNFPLDRFCNPLVRDDRKTNSCFLAQLARCAGEQGKFWDAVDYLMGSANLAQSSVDDLFLSTFCGAIDLEQVAIKECLDSGRHMGKVKSDIEEGIARGVGGTPTIYVNGKKIPVLDRGVMREILKTAVVELSAKE